MGVIQKLEAMLAQGQDNALLRYGLGNECLKMGDFAKAAEHFRQAVELDRGYSAAWKLLGQALAAAGQMQAAMAAYASGIDIAQANGDLQAAREMQVFLRRLENAR